MEKKVCGACLILKPMTEFYANPTSGDGYSGKCKVCQSHRISTRFGRCARCGQEVNVREFSKHLEMTGKKYSGNSICNECLEKATKRCLCCGEEKLKTLFPRDSTRTEGTKNLCKECNKKRQRDYATKKRSTLTEGIMTKIEQKLEGHTSVGRKIYNVVPIEYAWTTGEILSELRRNGVLVSKSAAIGCLKALAESGLINESSGRWKRKYAGVIYDKAKKDTSIVETKNEEPKMVRETVVAKDKKTPIDIMLSVSEKTREMQDTITVMMERWRKMVDDAALEISQQIDEASDDSKKLKQLQDILKSVAA